MGDDDMIRRGDALAAIPKVWWHYGDTKNAQAIIRAIPATDARETESQTVRADALKEAAALFNNWWVCAPDGSNITEDVQAAILAIINKDKP